MSMPMFGRKKRKRKYPIKRDEFGRSARSRCFEMFDDNIPLPDIAEALGLKIETVYTYHRQWKKDPEFDKAYAYLKRVLDKRAPDREPTLKLVAKISGMDKKEFETLLQKPHGLKRLMMGKIYFPKQSDADHRRYVALEIAMLIFNHTNGKGGIEDVYHAFERWLDEYKKRRESEEKQIEEENRRIEFARRIIQAVLENERQGRVQPDSLSPEEIGAILNWPVQKARKEMIFTYWTRIAELMYGGLTMEQAREKMYQDLIDKGDMEGAKMIRQLQDSIHPLQPKDQKPTSPSDKPARDV